MEAKAEFHQSRNNCVWHSTTMASRYSVPATRNWTYGSVLSWLQLIRHQTFEYDTFVPQTVCPESVRNANVKCWRHPLLVTSSEMSWLGSLCPCRLARLDQEEEEGEIGNGIASSSLLTLKDPVRFEMTSSVSSELSSCSDQSSLPENQQELIRSPVVQRRRANPTYLTNPALLLGRISEKSETSVCHALTCSYADQQRATSWPFFECTSSIPDTCCVFALVTHEPFRFSACVDQAVVWNDAVVWNQHFSNAKVVECTTSRNG